KPLVLNWPSAPDDHGDVLTFLEDNAVPCVLGAGRAAHTLTTLTEFTNKHVAFGQRGKRSSDRVVARQALELPPGAGTLGERGAKQLLQCYGVPVVQEVSLQPREIERLEVAPLAFPLAVKINSPDLPHKTEAGAVRLGIQSLSDLQQAAQ